jgi:hypothetical protein
MPPVIVPPSENGAEAYLRALFFRTEMKLIREITRKRGQGYVDYAEVAALERVRRTLQQMTKDAEKYVPLMIEHEFYQGAEAAAGYANAKALISPARSRAVEILADNLLGQVEEMAQTAYQSTASKLFLVGRLESDLFRQIGIEKAVESLAEGRGALTKTEEVIQAVKEQGITAFVDKAGHEWSLKSYGNMAVRTTVRQAQVAAVLTNDDEQDLYEIIKIGTTCPICAVYEGRVYSKSGTSPFYPPLSDAFGKIDPAGSNDLSNSFLNIHPNCLVPGGFVLAESVISESRRFYCGKVITLKTSAGNEITITPNHPVLTDRGFVPADGLTEGDKIIEASGKYGSFIRETPNNVNIKAVLNEELHAFMQTVSRSACSVKGTPEQFHGDGCIDQKVDIVFTNSLGTGERDVICSEKIKEQGFPTGQLRMVKLLCDSPFTKVFIGAFHSLDRIVGGFRLVRSIKRIPVHFKQLADLRERTAALLSNLRKRKTFVVEFEKFIKLRLMGFTVFFRNLPVRSSVGRTILDAFVISDTKIANGCGKCFRTKVVLPTNLSKTEPLVYKRLQVISSNGGLQVSRLCHKESSFYCGYVYNFETEHSFYVYNNIVTHNCLHTLVPYTEKGKTPKQVEKMRRFSNPETNPYDHDPRSKKQKQAYEEKERNRAIYRNNVKQYQKYLQAGVPGMPKTFQTFLKHKQLDDEQYRKWVSEFRKAKK